MSSERTPLVLEGTEVSSSVSQAEAKANHGHGIDQPKARLHKLHAAPLQSLLSSGMDVDSLRLSYASKLVLAAVEGRHVESAVDLLVVLKGDFGNPLAYPLYRTVLVCVILAHLGLALWEGGMSPMPLHPAVAASEAFVFLCYTAHTLLNLWTFGVKQFRDKKWHFTFTVLSVAHFLLLGVAVCAARWHRKKCAEMITPTDGTYPNCEWWNMPRLALLGAHALRPIILISQLRTTRRVLTNVLRTASRTGSILMLGAVALAFYSVLAINLFNSEQVEGYTADRDNFDNFGAAVLSLFVLTTEENFPMVADPSFSQRPLVAYPFFVSFLLLFLVVILPLLLGNVLDAYAQQHGRQNARFRRKARNALLAAYYVLDEDGAMGLSQAQLVGVLTAEAGVGIDRDQAEHLWQTIMHEDDDSFAKVTRSYSVPITNSNSWPHFPLSAPTTPRGSMEVVPPTTPKSVSSTLSMASVMEARAARMRDRALASSERGRMDVHGFLQLVDLLHEKVFESDDDDGGDSAAGIEERNASIGVAARNEADDGFYSEVVDENELHGESSGEGAESGCGGNGGDAEPVGQGIGSDHNGVRAGRVAAIFRQRLQRCAAKVLAVARVAARRSVGRVWFMRASQVIAVLLTLMALTWTPISQEWYNHCRDRSNRPHSSVCRGGDALRRIEGLLILAFLAEMTAKGLAIGWRRLWRLHWADRFDLMVLGASLLAYLVVGTPRNRTALYVDNHPGLSDLLDLPRAIIVLRLLTVFPALRMLLETMSTVAVMLLKIMVLYSCVSYSFAAIGMAIFADATSDILEPRYSFSTLPKAFLALFFLTVTNNWNDLLYPLVKSVRVGRWSSLFFVTYMLFCATMMLDVLVGVVIEGFRVSNKGPQQTPAARGLGSEGGNMGDGGLNVGNSVVDDDEASMSDGLGPTSLGIGLSRTSAAERPPSSRRGIWRKFRHRKYKQVKAEDMFRSDPQGELSSEDLRELEEAVGAVEQRLHIAWVNHVRDLGVTVDTV